MSKKKKSRFGQNVVDDVQVRKDASGGFKTYANLPSNIPVYKEKVGKQSFDIIPYMVTDKKHSDYHPEKGDNGKKGMPWYKRPVPVHHGIGAANESVICPKIKGHKERCPICEDRKRQYDDGVDPKKVTGGTSWRNIYMVVPLKSENYDSIPHIWDISSFNFQKTLDQELQEKPEKGIFPDPEQGFSIEARFVEESFGAGPKANKYAKCTRIDFEKRKKQYEESIMEEMPKLDDILIIHDYAILEKMLLEIDTDDEDSEPPFEKDKDAGSKRKKKSAKKVKEEEEEEEEEESPKKSKKDKKSKKIKEEPEEEEEEEEEEVIKKKKKKKKKND